MKSRPPKSCCSGDSVNISWFKNYISSSSTEWSRCYYFLLSPMLCFSKSNFVYLQLSTSRARTLVTLDLRGANNVRADSILLSIEECAANENPLSEGNVAIKACKVAPLMWLLSSSVIRDHHDSQLREQQQHRGVPVVRVWRQWERMAGLSAHPAHVQQQHMSAWVKRHEITRAQHKTPSVAAWTHLSCNITMSFLHEISASFKDRT